MTQRVGLGVLLVLIGATSLAGCITQAPKGEATPVTIVSLSPVTPTVTATVTRVQNPTLTVPSSPTMQPTLRTCARSIPNLEASIPLPDLSTLRWEMLEVSGQRLRQLAGLGYPAFPIQSSPDGRWLQLALQFHPTVYAGTAEAVIDTQDEAHGWLDMESSFYLDYYLTPHYYPRSPWLPDGRLLWGEGDTIFLGDWQNPQTLEPPDPVWEIRYASQGIAFARNTAGDLWRVDLTSGKWEKVTTSRPGNLGYFFSLAWDGSYGVAFQEGQMWRVPARMGAVAEPLPDVEVKIVGRGGGAAHPDGRGGAQPLLVDWPAHLVRGGRLGSRGVCG